MVDLDSNCTLLMENKSTFLSMVGTILGLLGSTGSVITGWRVWNENREILDLHRGKTLYDKYNALFGPWIGDSNEYFIYLTFRLINERRKILIKDIDCSIFDDFDQKVIPCEILSKPPKKDVDAGKVECVIEPGPFPEQHIQLGLTNGFEIPEKSARDYFLALKCPVFKIRDLHDQQKAGESQWIDKVSVDLTVTFKTTRKEPHRFTTNIWTRNPAHIPPESILSD